MSDYTEKRIKCDVCGRSIKFVFPLPAGWQEWSDYYGNTINCCPRDECSDQWDEVSANLGRRPQQPKGGE